MMNDEELAEYLGLRGEPAWQKFIDKVTPERRASYERMAAVEMEIKVWQAGVAPKPQGVIICGPKQVRGAK